MAALADALRDAPLTGPREKTSKEVRDWGGAVGISADAPDLLESYNEAATEGTSVLREQLSNLAEDPAGRVALIALLGETGASDHVRLLALDAIASHVTAEDAEELARVNVRQRAQVMPRALEVLVGTGSTDALFAAEKVLSDEDPSYGGLVRHLASRLWAELPEAELVRRVVESGSVQGELSDHDGTLKAVLALSSGEQARLAQSEAGRQFLEAISDAGVELDARLRAMAAESSSVPAYYMRLRDELLELALLTGVPGGEDLRKRALENLFRREDLRDVAEIAAFLPDDVLLEYARRALSRENRRGKRSDRAAAALRFVSAHGPTARQKLKGTAVECLTESDERLRFEAARLLAQDVEALDAGTRASLLEAFEKLPPALQTRLAPELRGVSDANAYVSLDAFLRWVDGASGDELGHRLQALLDRWAGAPDLDVDDVRRMIRAFGEGYGHLDPSVQERLSTELASVAADWLRGQGTRLVEPVRALFDWRRFEGGPRRRGAKSAPWTR